jgi:hypothetical protein
VVRVLGLVEVLRRGLIRRLLRLRAAVSVVAMERGQAVARVWVAELAVELVESRRRPMARVPVLVEAVGAGVVLLVRLLRGCRQLVRKGAATF